MCASLRLAAERGELTATLREVAASLAHMHAVRMLGPGVRAYERVIYDYLGRQYATRQALAR